MLLYYRFVKNLPGPDFVKGFLRRHKNLTVRTVNLIKRGRAAVSHEIVNDIFDNFYKVAAGVPPENIHNYDETNLQENPGGKKGIVKRGSKYPEEVGHFSRSAVSVMFCGSAAGEFLPPYVVYKATNHYKCWMVGGPKGARYNHSPSGWFDMPICEDWFFETYLPVATRLPGKKVLIGDNLSSHLSTKVIDACRENNIEFVCLPPNATDKMQPLDVGFFAQMKGAWRKQLREYKQKDPTALLLRKTEFPKMLKELVDGLDPQAHLPSAFRKCGLYPLNRQEVLNRIPSIVDSQAIARNLDDTLLKTLELRRFGDQSKKKPRGQKLPPGKSHSAQAARRRTARRRTMWRSLARRRPARRRTAGRRIAGRRKRRRRAAGRRNWRMRNCLTLTLRPVPSTSVVAIYEGQWFLADVAESQEKVGHGYTRLSYAAIKGNNCFAWAAKPDIMVTLNEDIIHTEVIMVLLNNRGHCGLTKQDLKKVENWMVVVYIPFNLKISTQYFLPISLAKRFSKLKLYFP